jgi:hypothetical protein
VSDPLGARGKSKATLLGCSTVAALFVVGAAGCGGTVGSSGGIAMNGTGGGNAMIGSGGSGGADASPAIGPPYAYFYANPVDYGQVFAVPAGAGGSVVLATGASPHNIGGALAFDADHIYYDDCLFGQSGCVSSIVAQRISGDGPRTTLASGLHTVKGLVVGGTALYVLDVFTQYGSAGPIYTTAVDKVPLSVSTPSDAGSVQKLTEDSDGGGTSLGVHGAYAYFTEEGSEQTPDGGLVKRVPLSGGAVEVLGKGQSLPTAIAVDETGAYWLDEGHPGRDCEATDGSLVYLAPGSTSPVVLAPNLAGARAVVALGSTVYFSTTGPGCNVRGLGGGTLWKLAAPSGVAAPFASKLTDPENFYVVGNELYFTVVTDESSYVLAPSVIGL